MNTVQLDGNGAGMSDSSSEDEDFDPLRRLVDKIGHDEHEEEQVSKSKISILFSQAIEEEPPLNSDDDEDGENLDHVFETDNIIMCQFEKVCLDATSLIFLIGEPHSHQMEAES